MLLLCLKVLPLTKACNALDSSVSMLVILVQFLLVFPCLIPHHGALAGRRMINYDRPVEISRTQTVAYFKSFLEGKSSSQDYLNEGAYSGDSFAEDLYHRLASGTFMSRSTYLTYLNRTRQITENEEVPWYASEPDLPCDPATVWEHNVSKILSAKKDGLRKISQDLETYHRLNQHTSQEAICNRFTGLSCQFAPNPDSSVNHENGESSGARTTCQCDGLSKDVQFYKKPSGIVGYPDGCYLRPWRSCQHLSVDPSFRRSHMDWHSSEENQRNLLAQMAFPVARTHRCRKGTYCIDLIPGMKAPVCWCTQNSNDPECKESHNTIPVLGDKELARVRTEFVKMIINAPDTYSVCQSELNDQVTAIVSALGEEAGTSRAVQLMNDILQYAVKQNKESNLDVRICDFREALVCDPVFHKCRPKVVCDAGKIYVGRGNCALNNGQSCRSSEECVEKAKCQMLPGSTESVCLCEGYYGDRCAKENAAFFSRLFVPTGELQGEKYIRQQEEINRVLHAWEEKMNLKSGDRCDPAKDWVSMDIVNYFGNLGEYDTQKGEWKLLLAKELGEDSQDLCMYHRFLRCHETKRMCVPFQGRRVIPKTLLEKEITSLQKISVQVERGDKCDTRSLPRIFQDLVVFSCDRGYACINDICQADCTSPFAPVEACGSRNTRQVGNSSPKPSLPLTTLAPITPDPIALEPATDATYEPETELPFGTTGLPGQSSTEGSTARPSPTSPRTPAPTPPDKGYIRCKNSDDPEDAHYIGDVTCDSSKYLICDDNDEKCVCHPGLELTIEGSCVIPLAAACLPEDINLPSYMNYDLLKCRYGECNEETFGHICRPDTDAHLMLIDMHSKGDV